jgi:hypothetical protein
LHKVCIHACRVNDNYVASFKFQRRSTKTPSLLRLYHIEYFNAKYNPIYRVLLNFVSYRIVSILFYQYTTLILTATYASFLMKHYPYHLMKIIIFFLFLFFFFFGKISWRNNFANKFSSRYFDVYVSSTHYSNDSGNLTSDWVV